MRKRRIRQRRRFSQLPRRSRQFVDAIHIAAAKRTDYEPNHEYPIREAIVANRSRISGLDTGATQQSAPSLLWRTLVSSTDRAPFRPARNSGGVGRKFIFAKSCGSTSQRNHAAGPIPRPRTQGTSPGTFNFRNRFQSGFSEQRHPVTSRVRRNAICHQYVWRWPRHPPP